jgi:hypothetical protein
VPGELAGAHQFRRSLLGLSEQLRDALGDLLYGSWCEVDLDTAGRRGESA